ncbi:MAG: hypothetical protein HGA56_06775 [Chlorobiaceae bacterium]|nr:hypothetical protein [Chlorobiaceae bacterium]
MLKESTVREALPFGKPSKPFDAAGFVKRYGLFVVIVASFLFTLTVPVVLMISKPNYEVHALMRIDPVIPSLITTSEDPSIINYYQDYANTQARRMMDFEILKKTVEKLSQKQKASILPAKLPAEKCADILPSIIKVNPVPGTHLIDVMASSPRKEGLAPLVNSFMRAFLEKVRQGNEMQDRERLAYLYHEKLSLSNSIAAIEANLAILTKDISTADFSETYNLASKKSEALQTIYVGALAEEITSKNNFQQTEKASRELKSLSLSPMVEERVMNDQSLDFTTSWTYQQQQQMRSTTDGLTAQNPDRIYVEQRMSAMKSYEKKLENEIRKNAKQIIYGKRDYELKKELIEAANKTEKAKKTEDELLKELQKSKEEAVRVSLGLQLGESLTARLKHNRDLLDRIDTRIHELEVEGKAPLRISVESQAREPEQPKGSNTQKLLMSFFALAFGGVGGIVFAFDFFDNRIRRSEEIKSALGCPPMPPVSQVSPDVPFRHLLQEAPDSPAAQAIGSLAVKLDLERKKNDARVILFTGVNREVGNSTIAFNCAQALARIVPRVLFVESALDSPSLFPDDRAGVAEYLAGEAHFSEFVVRSEAYRIDIMPVGQNRSATLPRLRIPELIEQVSRDYDVICVDSSPLLNSDLTELVTLSADVAVLVSQGESTLYRDLRRAAELLVRLEVPAIAPVLNWGAKRSVVPVDKLLATRLGFLGDVNTTNIEEFIRKLPPADEIMRNLSQHAGKLGDLVKRMSGKLRKKKREKTKI